MRWLWVFVGAAALFLFVSRAGEAHAMDCSHRSWETLVLIPLHVEEDGEVVEPDAESWLEVDNRFSSSLRVRHYRGASEEALCEARYVE